MADYSFVTTWRFRAPIERVWQAIHDYQDWPSWWPAIAEARQLQAGDANGLGEVASLTFRTRLPYDVKFIITTTHSRPPHELDGHATGELEGTGRWRLSQEGDITLVRYYWDVRTTRWWMNALAPLARPAFNWNHDQVMKSGRRGLTRRLAGQQSDGLPRMYHEFASWFPLITAPEDYAEEATFYWNVFLEASSIPPRTLLELGSGGGNMASHYKARFESTLVDLSAGMLAVSRSLNPECEHIQGDMRSLHLGREFDAVLVHDAVMYLTTEDELRQAVATAFAHCKPGGVAVFAPDHTRENFQSRTAHGGHDGDGRGLRYLEWTTDPNPDDSTYLVDFAYLMRENGRPMRVEHDRHIEGLFSRDVWLRLLTEAGFVASARPLLHSELPPDFTEIFVGVRPRE